VTAEHWLLKAALTLPGARNPGDELVVGGDLVARWDAISRATGVNVGELADAASGLLGIPRADFNDLETEYAESLPENVARLHMAIPLRLDEGHAQLAMADPTDEKSLQEIAFSLGSSVEARLATPDEIDTALTEIHGDAGGELKGWGRVPTSLLSAELTLRRKDGATISLGTSATAKLLVELLRRAHHMGASDTHVQPYGDGAVVRNRIDGVLYRTLDLPATVHSHLTRHVKAISGMDPTKHMIPQDGELHMELERRQVDLRLSVLPVAGSERLVVRLLPQNQVRTLSMLRLDAQEQQTLERLSGNADGMTLMTGPTGSGKSSLLYAMLAQKNTPNINIMTVEEPVEYRLRGASQIDVDPATGLTFASALRSILRQDPDVVMIGEIRDEETAEIAAQAAMTGHFVLSTVHTLDALLATVRMRDLGVSSVTLADALNAVASQRLVRRLCDACKAPLDEGEMSDDEKRFAELRSLPAWKGVGCDECRSTGFNGRVPVLEIVEATGEIREALRDGSVDIAKMEMMAAASGTRFLAEGFAARVTEGLTTVGEVVRVYGNGFFGRLEHAVNLRRATGDGSSGSE